MNRFDTFDPYRVQWPIANVLIRHLRRILRDIMSTHAGRTDEGRLRRKSHVVGCYFHVIHQRNFFFYKFTAVCYDEFVDTKRSLAITAINHSR